MLEGIKNYFICADRQPIDISQNKVYTSRAFDIETKDLATIPSPAASLEMELRLEELAAGLGMSSQVLGFDIEGTRGVGLLLGNVDVLPIHAPSMRT